ncbi:MAG: hypothetical protein IJ243_07410 [Prevotella sp.]|nr:hypothetical protein [Prevotella sp.]
MEEMNNEPNVMRQQMDIPQKKLSGEDVISDGTVQQALHDYVRAQSGSKALRIGTFSLFALAFIYLVWDAYESATSITVAAGIVLLAAFLFYKAGAFSSIETIVSQMDYESIEDLREEGKMIRRPWHHVAVVAAFMAFWTLLQYLEAFVGWEDEVHLSETLLMGLIMGVGCDVLRIYFYRRDAKKLLNAVDDVEEEEKGE